MTRAPFRENRLNQLLKRINWPVRQLAFYEQALTHSSYAYEHYNKGNLHNERLEFLGDAVLELLISDYLFRQYPDFPEGKLTRLRADIVCEPTLAWLAETLCLGEYLLLGRGETAEGGGKKPSLLSDALEALIGALYLDLGYQKAYTMTIELFEPVFKAMEKGVLRSDYKTLMQELSQSRFGKTPIYNLVGQTGPDHSRVFTAQLSIDGEILGRGKGRTKKEAEQAAAREAWNKLNLAEVSGCTSED